MLGRLINPGKGVAVFDPTTLVLSGYWRANYPGSAPWSATASAGVSSTTGALATNGSDPTSGTAQNGLTPALFNGSSNNLTNANDVITNNIWTKAAGTEIVLFKATSASTATGNVYDDPAFLVDNNYDAGMTFSTTGVGGFIYDGAYETVTVACSTGAYHLAMLRWNSSTVGITIDSGAESTHAAAAATVMTGAMLVGKWPGGAKYFSGNILELATASYAFSNADYANFKSYVNSRYALSL